MSDQDLLLDAVEEAQRVLAEYVDPGSRRNADATINMLMFLLGRRELWLLLIVCELATGCEW